MAPNSSRVRPNNLNTHFILGFFNNSWAAVFLGPEGQETRLVLVPDFASTSTAVLVNLKDLSVHPMKFNALEDSTSMKRGMEIS